MLTKARKLRTLSIYPPVAAVICLCSVTAGMAADLKVNISGFKNDKGVVRVNLFNSEKAFSNRDDDGSFKKAAVNIDGDSAVAIFKNLPDGEYALRYFHDEKNDGKPPRPSLGKMPEVGMSNNAKFGFGMSNVYKEAKFSVEGSNQKVLELTVAKGMKLPFLRGKFPKGEPTD